MTSALSRAPARALITLTLIWTLLIGIGELSFAYYTYGWGSSVACYPCAEDTARVMVRPGPWNGGMPWSQQKADAYVQYYRAELLAEVWSDSRLYLTLAAAALVGAWVVVAVRHTRTIHRTS